jgi:hypothetical protein
MLDRLAGKRPDERAHSIGRRVHTLVGKVLECLQGVMLHGAEGVYDEAVTSEVVEAQVDHEGVHGVGTVLEGFHEVGPMQRRASWEDDGLWEVPALTGGAPCQLRV